MNALEVFSSFEKAAELAKEQNSGCTLLASTERHIALSPKYIGRLRTGVSEILDAELGRFSESVRGVLLAYGNVKLLQSSGAIVDDSPFIHFDIKLDAVVFKPNIGSLLKCVVNEQASDHVGCLVHDWFNVSLLAGRKELNGQRLPKLEPGYVVLVQVERLRALNGMLAIEARAPDDGSDLILETVSFQGKDTDSESHVDSITQLSALDTPDGPSIPRAKRGKHTVALLDVDSHQPSVSDTVDESGPSTVTAGLETSSEKKKKRKRSKVKQELDVDSNQPSVSDTADKTGLSTVTAGLETSREKRNKRKHAKVKQELDVDLNQQSSPLEAPSSAPQTDEETSSPKNSKKHRRMELTAASDDPCTPIGTAELTAGEETSPKNKKRKGVKTEMMDSNSASLACKSGSDLGLITAEQSSRKRKKKRKDRETRTDVDLPHSPDIPNGATTIKLENEEPSKGERPVEDTKPLFSELTSSDKGFTKLKKRKDKENHTALDSCHQPLFSAEPSSPTPKKVKKRKKTVKQENHEFVTPDANGDFKTPKIRKESGYVSQSPLTSGSDTEVRSRKSHKKHKRKGAENAELDESLVGSSKNKIKREVYA